MQAEELPLLVGFMSPPSPQGNKPKEERNTAFTTSHKNSVFSLVIMQNPTFSFCSRTRGSAALNLAPSLKPVLVQQLRLSAHGWVTRRTPSEDVEARGPPQTGPHGGGYLPRHAHKPSNKPSAALTVNIGGLPEPQ